MVAGKGISTGTYDDFRGFNGLHQFQRLQRKLGLDDLLSNSAYKNTIYIRPRLPHFNGSDSQKHGKFYGFFQGLLLEKKALIGKFDNFRPLILTARNTENPRLFRNGCWKKEHQSINSTIFVDLQVSTNFGVSNGKARLDFLLPL